MADAATDALVAARYPKDWARANSKLRTKLRKRYRDDTEMSALQASGAKCLTCKHYRSPFFGEGNVLKTGMVCGLHTDHTGVSITRPDDLCLDWKGVETNAQ